MKPNGVFTLPDTDTNTDKMGLQPNCICVGVCISVGQYEHLHTILHNPFFIGVSVGQCEHPITHVINISMTVAFKPLTHLIIQ